MGEPLSIEAVVTKADLERFIRLPNDLFGDDPNWRAPLLFERREALSPKHNPYFEHAQARFWIARRGGRDVGRISAQIDELAQSDGAGTLGHFGMIAAVDDPKVFAALFAAAEAWLRERGCVRVLGPFNLSVNEETGLLVDGFETPPSMMMGHDPAYAAGRVEALGYAKAKDMFAYASRMPVFPKAVLARIERPRAGVKLRPIDMKRFDEEIRTVVEIFNDAWSGNWGFIPMTEAETRHLGNSLKPILDPRLVAFLEIDGEDAGMMVMLHNVNEAAHGLHGKLFPFGWARMLWRLKVSGVTSCRVPLMGIKRKFARDPRGIIGPFMMMHRIATNGDRMGLRTCEMSWVLEDNRPMRHIIEALGAQHYKTYRVYEKALA